MELVISQYFRKQLMYTLLLRITTFLEKTRIKPEGNDQLKGGEPMSRLFQCNNIGKPRYVQVK